jgi:TrmH family RNA methyltransferase
VETIVSRRNPLVARCRTLARGRTDEDPAVVLDGWHLLEEAIGAGMGIDVVAIADRAFRAAAGDARRLADAAAARGARTVRVSDSVLEAMSPVGTPSGVVGIARLPEWPLDAIVRPPPALVLVAIDVQDPGNVGAIVRVADAAGGTGVIVAGASADPWGWKALRGAMGSAFRLPLVRGPDAGSLLASLRARGLRIVATGPRVGRPLYDYDLRRPTALLFGSEGAGLAEPLASLADESLLIPMRRTVDSLNVATAAAIVAYEARRQRTLDACATSASP